jgi:predicted nuclease of predicted toxin-antitoxin system
MKLLFDQNLSFKLIRLLADVYPGSDQVRLLNLDTADDLLIWTYAAQNQFTIVTQDVDFANLSLLRDHPPKVIWLRCGNQPTAVVERILRANATAIVAFEQDASAGLMELFR